MAHPIDIEVEEIRKLRATKIRELRVARGLRKSQLALRCGSSYSHIDNIEHGRRIPSIQLLHRLAPELGVEFDDLALGDPTLRDAT
ncbi:helix-turn-helix domain-containing protein [Actinomadura geliboluensis]|uniref:helix-turn-helix domain-containing protein n=1 Tax=Actinomadura geliboluensis TaxID=882440 RepID=UPI0036B7035A